MPINFIKRTIYTHQSPQIIEEVEVFYIIWTKNNNEYYLCDASPDNDTLMWSTNVDSAVQFSDGHDALEICKEIKETRKGRIELKMSLREIEVGDYSGWII